MSARVRRAGGLALAVVLAAACGGGSAPSPTSRMASTFQEWASDHCAAAQAVFLGYGNPDTAGLSPQMQAFETAVEQGDAVGAAVKGAAVKAMFDHGREHARNGSGWAPGATAMSHLDRFLAGLTRMVDAEIGAIGNGLGPAKQAGQAAFMTETGPDDWYGWLKGVGTAMDEAGVASLPPCEGVPF